MLSFLYPLFVKQKLFFLFIMISASSCDSIIKNIYGINEPTSNQAQITALAHKSGVQQFYYLDKNKYLSFIRKKLTDSNTIQKFCQPLQILSFKDGVLHSMSVNCNAQGFPNLKWAIQPDSLGRFSSGNVSQIPEQIYTQNYLSACGVDSTLYDAKNQIVVQWSYLTGRQTRLLLKKIQKKYPKKHIIYINNDAIFYNE